MKTLILYLSQDGQTKKIAERIGTALNTPFELVNLADKPMIDWQQYHTIVLGAPIRYGKFNPLLEQFIAQNHQQLMEKKSALFTVNLTARKADKNSPETNVYTRKLLARIKWKPTLTAVFAGALLYPRYSLFDRIMIRFIMKITGGETDTTKEIEYTDWQKVDDFSQKIKQLSDK